MSVVAESSPVKPAFMKHPLRRLFHPTGTLLNPTGTYGYDPEFMALEGTLYGRFQADIENIVSRTQGDEARAASLSELLSEESCKKWLARRSEAEWGPLLPPFVNADAIHVWESDWPDEWNLGKLSLYRMAAFIEHFPCRCGRLNWRSADVQDMGIVEGFARKFSTHVQEREDMIYDLSRPEVALEAIIQSDRAPRLELSHAELHYVWKTNHLSHEDRVKAWDNRAPNPFQPFGRPNCEMYEENGQGWCALLNRLKAKAEKFYGPNPSQNERELK